MRIVHVILEAFDTPVSGADIRNHGLAEGLRALGPLRVIGASNLRGRDAPEVCPRTVLPLSAEAIAQALHEITDFAPDVVVLGGVGLLRLAEPLRRALPHARRIVDFHNVESLLLQEMDLAENPNAAARLAAGWRAAEDADRAIAAWGAALWCCSEADIARARSLGIATPAHVVPNAPPPWARPMPLRPARAPRLLFMAHLGYPPNIGAARMLIEGILPGLRASLPGAEAVVAGRDPAPDLLAAARGVAGLRLPADPGDPAPLYDRASVAVMPILEGGGTRIKVLEALRVGRPIVASAKAVEGHGLTPGLHYLPAETAPEFVAQILRLQADPARGEALIAAGRDWMVRHASAEALRDAIAAGLNEKPRPA
ncbi:glycosyltransferase [Pseudothioclava arenosa]|nr:glycosyltransferase [Pseudothioclava arenosa]